MANTTKTYLSVISKDDKSKNQADMKMAAKNAKLQVQVDLLKLEGQINKANQYVDAARYAVPYNSLNLLEAKNELKDVIEDYDFLKAEEEFHVA
jgi:hypothetical protein